MAEKSMTYEEQRAILDANRELYHQRLDAALDAERPTKQQVIICSSAIGGPDILDFDALDKWTEAQCEVALNWASALIASANDNIVRKKRLLQPEFTVGVLCR